ncbi:MAG: Aldo/keto reductase [Flaviaesturariibacter sp.]|nr:Aldo/keto reductase [Flaviaesturariibacter sp.]
MIQRVIPSTGEAIPAIGLGAWQTFDLAPDAPRADVSAVLDTCLRHGCRLIDCSPMYGRAEEVVGEIAKGSNDFFYATKVWTTGREAGIRQMTDSLRKMRRTVIDLMQIHNLVDWRTHLATLRRWKEEGRVRYIGITHYTDGMHEELERLLRAEPVDFVQVNYSITDRHAEKRLLPAAADLGVATLINRPFGEGRLFQKVAGRPLPPLASTLGITSWSALFLAFVLSNPAVTCVIPATSNPAHAAANLAAGSTQLPDAAAREEMAATLAR